MKFQINRNFLIIFLTIFLLSSKSNSKLIPFQSEYEISNVQKEEARIPGRTYVDKATGYLVIDWLNSCENSWVSNQRMMTRFVNSHGVGTVSEINYSLNELDNGEKMDFVLEIKENAEVQERFYGMAKKVSDLEIKFKDREIKHNFPSDVIFPRQFLEDIISNLNSKKKIMVRNVYEGTIPDKYFKISVFFTDEIQTIENDILPKNISNKFRKVKMAYYQDNEQTPIFEQTVLLNNQGIANSFQYDYPDYSLLLKLKKIKLVPTECK
jgi:hypothetical protein